MAVEMLRIPPQAFSPPQLSQSPYSLKSVAQIQWQLSWTTLNRHYSGFSTRFVLHFLPRKHQCHMNLASESNNERTCNNEERLLFNSKHRTKLLNSASKPTLSDCSTSWYWLAQSCALNYWLQGTQTTFLFLRSFLNRFWSFRHNAEETSSHSKSGILTLTFFNDKIFVFTK